MTTTHSEGGRVSSYRPGLRSLWVMVVSEAKMVIRDYAGLVVPIGFPLLILVMTASSAASDQAQDGLSGLEAFVLPLVFGIVIASIGVINMPSFLAYYRKSGILRRLAVTPASPVMVLLSQVLVSTIQAVIGIGLALGVAVVGFDAALPERAVLMAAVLLLGLLAMYGIGMLVAAFSPSPNSAVAIGLVAFFALGATGGMFGGPAALPGAVATVGEYLPFRATIDLLGELWANEPLSVGAIGVLAGWTVLGTVVAARFFRWDR